MTSLSVDESVVVPGHVVVRAMPEATILLNSRTGRYFTLDAAGAAAWMALTGTSSLGGARDRLLAEFDVAADVLWDDLSRLVRQLEDEGLVERRRG